MRLTLGALSDTWPPAGADGPWRLAGVSATLSGLCPAPGARAAGSPLQWHLSRCDCDSVLVFSDYLYKVLIP